MSEKIIRKGINMSVTLAGWYENKARELGISQSALMVMALSEYIKQDKAVDIISNLKDIMSVMKDSRS